MVLFVNPLTPRVKPWVIQSFLTFDSMDRTLKCDHSSNDFFCCTQIVVLENLSILDLALLGVKGFILFLSNNCTYKMYVMTPSDHRSHILS